MRKKILLMTSLLSGLAQAGISYITYDKDKIPNIITAAGIATEIIFEADESIVYHTFGFESAWNTAVVREHILVFKSKDAQPQTNLLVHTDKRDYIFTVTVGNNEWETHPKNSEANYSLRMVYHDDKAMQNAEKQRGVLRNQQLDTSYKYYDYDYRATKNANSIIPTNVWDNGTITFVKLKRGTKRPVIFEIDESGKEHLVNQNTERNGLLVVHGVYDRLMIRLGDSAVELRRNIIGGHTELGTKTTVIGTTRTISISAPTEFPEPSPEIETQPLFRGIDNEG